MAKTSKKPKTPEKSAEALLGEARVAMDRGDLAGSLALLAGGWRACRHPRIADLIDRVSAEVDRARGPISGRTVKERCDAWHEIEEQRDPADFGRLLAVLWPANGKLGLSIHTKVLNWPDDPRIPRVWLQMPRRGYADRAMWWTKICERIAAYGDVRIVPELSKQTLPNEVRRQITALRAQQPPALSPALEDLLAAMERGYVTDICREQSQARGEPEMLGAIYAAPDDLAQREVYADWLTEHGDPRGELITLQRARSSGRSTPKAEQRERALLDEHGERWAGPLAKILDHRIFTDGFLSGGRLHKDVAGWRATSKRIDPIAKLAEWKLIRRLDISVREIEPAQMLDDLPHLEGLFIRRDQIGAVVSGPVRRHLRELGCLSDDAFSLDKGSALPELRALTLAANSATAGRLPRSKVGAQLERVTLVSFAPPVALVERLLALPNLVELTMHGYDSMLLATDPDLEPHGFELRIARDRSVRGAFHRSKRPSWAPQSALGKIVARFLAALPRDIKSLVIEPSRSFRFEPEERGTIDDVVGRFEKLEGLELPWR